MTKITQKIAMGAWAWGDKDGYFGNTMTRDEFRPVFTAALKNGLNFFDTATAYGNGASEEILGTFLKEVEREKIIISTKFTPQMAAMYENSLAKMCEASLARMGIDYIDLYWIHNSVGAPKWTKELIPLLKKGIVKQVGVSNHNLAEIEIANKILSEEGFKLSAIQNHFSLLNRTSEYGGILNYCAKNNIDFLGYMVLEQGALSGKYDTKNPFPQGSARAEKYNSKLGEIEKLVNAMKPVAENHGSNVAQIATAWAISKGVIPIIGVTKVSQVEDAAAIARIQLTNEEIKSIENVANKLNISTIREWEKDMSNEE